MNARIATIAALAVSLACSERGTTQPSPVTSPALEAPTVPTQEARVAPITVRADGPAQVAAGESITLTVTITRAVAGTDPVQLAVVLPDGVTVAQGDANERIVEAGPVIVRRLQLKVEHETGEDVTVTATVRGEHYGAHAKSAYRFGRPEPRLRQPPGPGVGLTGGPARKQQ